jgi:hypothetical protein
VRDLDVDDLILHNHRTDAVAVLGVAGRKSSPPSIAATVSHEGTGS